MLELKGSCNCKAITFTVKTRGDGGSVCHCGQCRKQSGHVWASDYTDVENFDIQGDVRWFEASTSAKRGFCPICGSFLFWKAHDEETMSFSLGAIDGRTGLKVKKHIFVADKGDYYDITDDLPQSP